MRGMGRGATPGIMRKYLTATEAGMRGACQDS